MIEIPISHDQSKQIRDVNTITLRPEKSSGGIGTSFLNFLSFIALPSAVTLLFIFLPSILSSSFPSWNTNTLLNIIFSSGSCPLWMLLTVYPVRTLYPQLFSTTFYVVVCISVTLCIWVFSFLIFFYYSQFDQTQWMYFFMRIWNAWIWPAMVSLYIYRNSNIIRGDSSSVNPWIARRMSAESKATDTHSRTLSSSYNSHQDNCDSPSLKETTEIIIHNGRVREDLRIESKYTTICTTDSIVLIEKDEREFVCYHHGCFQYNQWWGCITKDCGRCPCSIYSKQGSSWSYSPWMHIWMGWSLFYQLIQIFDIDPFSLHSSSSVISYSQMDFGIFVLLLVIWMIWIIFIEQWYTWIFHPSYLLLYVSLFPLLTIYINQTIVQEWLFSCGSSWTQILVISLISTCYDTLISYVTEKMAAPYLYLEFTFLSQVLSYAYEFSIFGIAPWSWSNCMSLIITQLHHMLMTIGFYGTLWNRYCCTFFFIDGSKCLRDVLSIASRARILSQDLLAHLSCLIVIPILLYCFRYQLSKSELQTFLIEEVKMDSFSIRIITILAIRAFFAFWTYTLLSQQMRNLKILKISWADQLNVYLTQMKIPSVQLFHFRQRYIQEYPVLFDTYAKPPDQISTISLYSFIVLTPRLFYFGLMLSFIMSNIYQQYQLKRPGFL